MRVRISVPPHRVQCTLTQRAGAPRINVTLCASGGPPITAAAPIHIVVATLGRLIDTLRRNQLSLAACEVLAIDEADRVIDFDFKEDFRTIVPHMRVRRGAAHVYRAQGDI